MALRGHGLGTTPPSPAIRIPYCPDKWGHPKVFGGDTPALTHPTCWWLQGARRQSQEGMGRVLGLPCPTLGHQPLMTSSVVPGEGSRLCCCLSGMSAVSNCPSPQVAMPHQWLEGNLPVSARCAVCDRACGSVRRLQDWRCLWCKAIVRICPSLSPSLPPGQHCPSWVHSGEAEAGAFGAASFSFAYARVPLSPGSQCLQGTLWQEVPPGPVQSVHHPAYCLEQH